jgi:hypothetical protein
MNQSAPWTGTGELQFQAAKRLRRRSSIEFLWRYPILLLAFGPPAFKGTVAGDTSQAHFDIWNVIQVCWLFAISLRAISRLVYLPSVRIPRQIQSILKYFLFLGLLFMASVVYSPGRIVSSEFLVLYSLNLICLVEFLVDVYQDPPDWMECLFQLRRIAIVLMILVLLCLPIRPGYVMTSVAGSGLRLMGGSVGQMPVLCPIIVIISAYTFLHSLEPRGRAFLLFLVGLAGVAVTQTRGAELSVLIVLAILGIEWAKASQRRANILVFGLISMVLLAGIGLAMIGGERVLNTVNRGQDLTNTLTASGRTVYWEDLILYCVGHPQGMGYIAGIRHAKLGIYATDLHAVLNGVGGADNSYMQVLSDAGWISLALYLVMLSKIFALGWRFAKRKNLSAQFERKPVTDHALRCALFLFAFCLIEQMENSEFVIPLRQPFYIQNIIIAIILGISISMIHASRPRYA